MDRDHELPRPLARWARFGFVARGVVYLVVGALATMAALGIDEGATTDGKGALVTVFAQPLGTTLLALLTVGLFGYAAFLAADAILDADRRGATLKAIVVRVGLFGAALAHAALAIFAAKLLLGEGAERGDRIAEWTGRAFGLPFGRLLVAGVGITTIIVGIVRAVKGAKAKFQKRLEHPCGPWACALGRLGHISRGVVIVIVGGFLVTAAWRFHSREARGLAGALGALQDQPFGQALLGAVALGLIAFGLFSMVEARLRRIPERDKGDGVTRELQAKLAGS
jgi:hypothetical protein